MPAPSKLAIATSAVSRLLKEEASYHKELAQGEERIKKLETNNEGENADFQMKQEKKAVEETKAVFPSLRQRIMAAASELEKQLHELPEGTGADEVEKAKSALQEAKTIKE